MTLHEETQNGGPAAVQRSYHPTTYDQIPYPDLSYVHTYPDRLATLGTLLGMQPAPVEHCRILELGCASGGNLLPMAYQLPNAEFVGIDNSQRQVETGMERAHQMRPATPSEPERADITRTLAKATVDADLEPALQWLAKSALLSA